MKRLIYVLFVCLAASAFGTEMHYDNIEIQRHSSPAQLTLDGAHGDVIFLENEALSFLLRMDSDSDGGTFDFQDRVGGVSSRLFIDGKGEVGIGTTNPAKNLDVVGSDNPTIRIRQSNENPGWGLNFMQKSDLSGFISIGGRDLNIGTGWDKRLILGVPQYDTSGGSVVIPWGNVAIGQTSPGPNKLDVNGTIRAKEIIVETNWADYVFDDGYELRSLDSVASFISENRRLPGIPSAEEVAENGVSVGQSQRLLLEKIEELTLYLIEKEEQMKEIRETNLRMANLNRTLLNRVEALEAKVK